MNLKQYTFLPSFVFSFCAFFTLAPADLTTDQQVEMGLAALRGATGMYNSYTFINKPSQFKRSEIVAKLSSIAHDSMNIYNTHRTEHYRLQQSLRLVHDACSLGHILLTSQSSNLINENFTEAIEAMRTALQALHYALPGIQSGAALIAATKTSSNIVDNLKAHSIAQAATSLCHFINDALKAPNNPNLLYTRLSLCAASLGLLTYELKNINTDERQDKDKIGNADKKTNTNNNKETKDGSANIESSDSESDQESNNEDDATPLFTSPEEAGELMMRLVQNIKNIKNVHSNDFIKEDHAALFVFFEQQIKIVEKFIDWVTATFPHDNSIDGAPRVHNGLLRFIRTIKNMEKRWGKEIISLEDFHANLWLFYGSQCGGIRQSKESIEQRTHVDLYTRSLELFEKSQQDFLKILYKLYGQK